MNLIFDTHAHYDDEAFDADAPDELTDTFLADVAAATSFRTNPLYAVLHESIYAQSGTGPTAWAAEAVRAESLKKTKNAMLSRAVCMQRKGALVINFPGSERAARECWEVVAPVMEHARHMASGEHH